MNHRATELPFYSPLQLSLVSSHREKESSVPMQHKGQFESSFVDHETSMATPKGDIEKLCSTNVIPAMAPVVGHLHLPFALPGSTVWICSPLCTVGGTLFHKSCVANAEASHVVLGQGFRMCFR